MKCFKTVISYRLPQYIWLAILLALSTSRASAQGDNCNSASYLSDVSNFCSADGFYNNATGTLDVNPQPFCWSGSPTKDVWFKFTAIAPAAYITVTGSGNSPIIRQPRIALYSGDCSSGLTEVYCSDGTSGTNFSQLYSGLLNPGQTYYIAVSSLASQAGRFKLCVNNYTPPNNPGADCGGATRLCSKEALSISSFSGPGQTADEPEPGTCMDIAGVSDETNSVWFYWTCSQTGSFTFDILPVDPGQDIDFLFYKLNGTSPCNSRQWLRCNASSCVSGGFAGPGSTGLHALDNDTDESPGCEAGENAYCESVTLIAGESYALLINNATQYDGFTIQFGGTAKFEGAEPKMSLSVDTICQGENVTVDGIGSSGFENLNWNLSSGSGSPSTAQGIGPHVINYNTPGTHTIILNATSANCPSVTLTKTVVVTPSPQAPQIITEPVCEGDTLRLQTNSTGILNWTGPNSFSSTESTITIPNASSMNNGIYRVFETMGNCIGSQASVEVSVRDKPTVLITPTNAVICISDTVVFTESGATSYTWIPNDYLTFLPNHAVRAQPDESISYSILAKNEAGCVDSTKVNIKVVTSLTAEAGNDISICKGDSIPLLGSGGNLFNWSPTDGLSNDSIFNPIARPSETTTYFMTTKAGSCQGVDSIKITVNPSPDLSITGADSICRGSSVTLTANSPASIHWSTNQTNPFIIVSPDSTQSYWVEAESANGCKTRLEKSIYVKPIPNILPSQSPINLCLGNSLSITLRGADNYQWSPQPASSNFSADTVTLSPTTTTVYTITGALNGCFSQITDTVYLQPPLHTNAGEDQQICHRDSIQLNATGGTSFAWTSNGIILYSGNNFWAKPDSTVEYQVTAMQNSCTDIDTIQITVLPLPNPQIGGDTVLCIGDTTHLFSTHPTEKSLWYPGLQTSSNIVWIPAKSEFISLVLTDQNGCSDSSATYLKINQLPSVTILGQDTLCENQFIDLKASGANQFQWISGQNGSTSIRLYPSSDTLVILTGIDANGCKNSDSLYLRVLPIPSVSAWPISKLSCKFDNVSFTGSGASQYFWNYSNLQGSTISLPALYDTTLILQGFAANGCSDTASVHINLFPQPVVLISGADSVCANTPFSLSASGASNYLWPQFSSNDSILHTSITNDLEILVIGKDQNQCTDSTLLKIAVYPVSAKYSYSLSYHTQPGKLLFKNQSTNSFHNEWLLNNQPYSSLPNPTYSGENIDDLVFTLISTNAIGCKDTISQLINYNPFADLFIPKCFSPDGDAINDLFVINGDLLEKIELRMYDRWGNQVWHSTSINESWDGQFNGEPLPAGTLNLVVKYRLIGGTDNVTYATVTIIR